MSYKLTVGLEIHAELKTKTKMFCNSAYACDRFDYMAERMVVLRYGKVK